MNKGKCKLCLNNKNLCDSHLLAKSFYRLHNRDKDPIFLTSKRKTVTSKQIKNHLLCKDCEQLFNERGERYVQNICYRDDGSFIINDYISKLPIKEDLGNIKLYKYDGSSQLNIDKIIYFGMSVFWRSAVHLWRIGHREYIKNYFGKIYTENFRLFLLDKEPYPNHIAMYVFVDSSKKYPILSTPKGIKTDTFWTYKFQVPGIQYFLQIGKSVPKIHRDNDTFRAGTLLFVDFQTGGSFKELLRTLNRHKP